MPFHAIFFLCYEPVLPYFLSYFETDLHNYLFLITRRFLVFVFFHAFGTFLLLTVVVGTSLSGYRGTLLYLVTRCSN